MTLTWLDPAHLDQRDIDGAVAVLEASREVEAPQELPVTPRWYRTSLNHGWDGDPPEGAVYRDESGRVVAVLEVALPHWDNHHAAYVNLTVDPVLRGRGLGSELFQVIEKKSRDAGRTLLLVDVWAGAAGEQFLQHRGFHKATEYVNRRQDLVTFDWDGLERDLAAAAAKAQGYELVRMPEKIPDAMMDQVVRMTAAINDAPLDDLKVEDEVYSPERIRAFEAAQAAYGRRVYRLVARERATGAFAGQTIACVQEGTPWHGEQFDTSVLAEHRGHRLGFWLKAAMLQWLREAEPQVRYMNTWNAASNDHMIAVNEELGYRERGRFLGYQRDYAAQP